MGFILREQFEFWLMNLEDFEVQVFFRCGFKLYSFIHKCRGRLNTIERKPNLNYTFSFDK